MAKRKTTKSNAGRKCSICTHPNVKEINSAINVPESFRRISLRYGMSDVSVGRHTQNCLKLEISALIKQKKIENAIDHYKEIGEQLEFAKDLRIAARHYLTDPVTNKISLDYRADEIDVIYYDFTKVIANGGNKREKAKLQDLLNWVTENRSQIEPQSTVLKQVDIRSFALDSIKTTDIVLDKIFKLEGAYQKDKENDSELNKIKILIQKGADRKGNTFEQELQFILDNFAEFYPKQLLDTLKSEFIN